MNQRKEIASSLALILFSATFLVYTTRYPLEDWENPGPAVFPLVLGGILLVLSSWQLFRALMAPKPPAGDGKRGLGIEVVKKFLRDNSGEAKVVTLTVMLFLYILMITWLGFFVSTLLLVVLSSRLMEARGWGRPIALAVTVCLFCWLLFEVWIKLSFPRGILF